MKFAQIKYMHCYSKRSIVQRYIVVSGPGHLVFSLSQSNTITFKTPGNTILNIFMQYISLLWGGQTHRKTHLWRETLSIFHINATQLVAGYLHATWQTTCSGQANIPRIETIAMVSEIRLSQLCRPVAYVTYMDNMNLRYVGSINTYSDEAFVNEQGIILSGGVCGSKRTEATSMTRNKRQLFIPDSIRVKIIFNLDLGFNYRPKQSMALH